MIRSPCLTDLQPGSNSLKSDDKQNEAVHPVTLARQEH